MKKCCQPDAKPSKAKKFFDRSITVIIVLLILGLIVSYFLNK